MGYGLKTSYADNQLKNYVPVVKVTGVTIPSNSFALNSSTGMYECTISDERITSNSIVNIILDAQSITIANDANMSSNINSIDGGVTLSCKKKPSSNMSCSYMIF